MQQHRLFILLPNWVGDAVMATPLLRTTRGQCAASHITFGGPSHIIELFRSCPHADDLFDIDGESTSRVPKGGVLGKISSIRHRARRLRRGRFDTALLLPGSFGSALISWLAAIPQRRGYAREARGLLLTQSSPHPVDFRRSHRVGYYLGLAPLAGDHIPGDESSPTPSTHPLELFIDDEARQWADTFLAPFASQGPLIGLHMGASYGPSKCWPPGLFAETLRIVAREVGPVSVLIVGGPGETRLGEATAADLEDDGIRTLVAAGLTTTVVELAALIDRCALFLSNDSGPMHVAAALGKPQVALFTSTSPTFTAPWNEHAHVIHAGVECSPCFERGCSRIDSARPSSYPCHDAVKPEVVARTIIERRLLRP